MTISEALRKGRKIAEENGIKHGKHMILYYDPEKPEDCMACALGEILIGVVGFEKAVKSDDSPYARVVELFPELSSKDKSPCIISQIEPQGKFKVDSELKSAIMWANDCRSLETEELAEILEKCDL